MRRWPEIFQLLEAAANARGHRGWTQIVGAGSRSKPGCFGGGRLSRGRHSHPFVDTRSGADLLAASKKDGALAIHITNAHVDLLPVVKGLARNMGMTAKFYETEVSSWVILKPGVASVDGKIIEWTDDRSSILAVLKPYHPAPELR